MVDIIAHFIFSLLIGFTFWKIFEGKQKKILFLCLFFSLLSGFFIDVDHLFDYYKMYGFSWNFQLFIAEDYFTKTNYVLFHGYEYVFILGLIAFFVENRIKRLFFTILAASLFIHLVIDIIIAQSPIQNYFIIYRLLHGFSIY
ncbi:MAG TPA: hypothetical protein VLF89_01010 [Candidatus Saccharimonadales bacterium]|nr:hypothetical protein [Candidatus Saccharimonadales bacterium]